MYSVLILWAPDTAENRRVIENITRAIEPTKIVPVVKKAAEATIADVNASDIIIFGVQKMGMADLPPDYSEFLRIFKGITLAGRTAGIFSMGSEKASHRLRKALKETEIALVEDDPLFTDQKQGISAEIADWVKKLIGSHKELQNARA